MKKIFIVCMVVATALFAGNAMANGFGNGNGHNNGLGNGMVGIAGLEISGGAAVGAQGYLGSAVTLSSYDSAFNQANAIEHNRYVGINLMTSANGMGTITTQGNVGGNVNGYGSFSSGISGSLLGIDFYSHSAVGITGVAR